MRNSIERKPRQDDRFASETTGAHLENILEWASLYAAYLLGASSCVAKHRQWLATHGESSERLREFADWRQSPAFTMREKAAFGLSESISLEKADDSSGEALHEVRRHFNTSEMVCLTLAIMAVNDWINLHSTQRICVLVVEDNPQDQELLHFQLRETQMDGNITFVSNGSEAIELLTGPEGESFRKNLVAIFLDLHLPGMNGVELLRRIRTLEGMENFPVIVMTSSNRPEDLEECHKLKVVGYVGKPITYCSFANAIANIFHQTTSIGRR